MTQHPRTRHRYDPDRTYVAHDFPERTFGTGEIHLNYAVAGADDLPALLLHSEVDTSCGQSLPQGVGPMFALWSKHLGDQRAEHAPRTRPGRSGRFGES
ncbi:hypothetical protein ACGFNP_47980 [Nonomuraea sp. NPDC049269]|uniref:hypothetical protein n=1 Tax=Nonomuraea sp. NPDC049269 TaxID=3364349 RepID=UPI0037224915